MEKDRERRIIGVIFCQVRRSKADAHEILFITAGNQKWKGAVPSFIDSPTGIRKGRVWLIAPRRSSLDPRAWKRRYFSLASDS